MNVVQAALRPGARDAILFTQRRTIAAGAVSE